jgi:uncharacterized membrane protein YccC
MNLDTRFMEAFKVALAFALVYGIALKMAWLNPSWAGFGVAMIAMQTGGQSIHKGLDRLAGTIPGCIAALVILALAPQERWLFMAYTALWVFFTSYMMIRSKNHTYFWNVAGFVCLVILLTGPASAASDFQHAVFRTLETALGISVYTLITVFLWPVNNAGAIKSSINDLAVTFEDRNQAIWRVISGQTDSDKLENLHQQSVQQLSQFSQALIAEGSENYEVHEMRPALDQVHQLATLLMESQDRLETNLQEITRLDVKILFPSLEDFFIAQNLRLDKINQSLKTDKPVEASRPVDLRADKTALRQLSGFDTAAVVIFEKELRRLDSLVAEMLDCVQGIRGNSASVSPQVTHIERSREPSLWLPVIDRDHFMGALFPTLCMTAGFLIWIAFNPPGHSAWVQLPATVAMMVGATQQTRTSAFFKPFAIMMTLALAVYVLVLPQLSSFVGLGLTLFMCAFVARYFFSGLAQLAGMVSIIMIISVQNQQSYDFAAQANTLIYVLLAFLLVYAMSYLLGSTRPEKVVLKMTKRFFRSAQFIIPQIIREPNDKPSWLEQWKLAYCRNEMATLPAKLEAWGKSIDSRLFPNTSQEHIGHLVTSLQSIVYRFEELQSAKRSSQINQTTTGQFVAGLRKWAEELEFTFERWSEWPDASGDDRRRQKIKAWLPAFERRTEESLLRSGNEIPEDARENLYRFLGGLRGLSRATLNYAQVRHHVDWDQWREERFS